MSETDPSPAYLTGEHLAEALRIAAARVGA